ncbi:MAG: 2,3-bisphosphoglycerate-independent phosphoglycerate mutase [Bacteroidetes bacterium]|nr:MAG: 2,3-bisphosphoglycerate-independent phosphoglycerate mutase [Bacteroidota bacterium]MBL1144794.1 2,3-bisphosphoglycerate-independent phosphoglycerate mutase [Bacteroidota bacterium]NOG57588.1 2,3-bisphosphoglycerate-independent phosphoglycerate mutase [Bacteroidota bacterium]
MVKSKRVALLIIDGWGYGKKDKSDAIFQANTPVFDDLISTYPNATLLTDGLNVGLPKGQMGNSEVGHLNIGAGRVVYQDLVKINNAIEDDSISTNPELIKAIEYAKNENKSIHFIGLVSDGGIHSHQKHLEKLSEIASKNGLSNIFIHAFTDGRDTDPNSGKKFLANLQKHNQKTGAKIASITGRYYAMDRDLRWERIKIAYDALVHGKGTTSKNLLESVQKSYDAGISDEFIKPIIALDNQGDPIARIRENDVVVCFNYRTDRCREITRALSQEDFEDFDMFKLPLNYVTMTNYDNSFQGVSVLFQKDNLKNTLGEVLSKAGKKQIRIAETEKYPHVTFFFSGGREKPFEGEKRIMAASPKVATYDLQPEMNAKEVKTKIIAEIKNKSADFICLNFANPDMVGHTGVFSAIIKAVETVDQYTGEIVKAGLENDYSFIIIADHGNADYAINEDGSANTAHTTNPVPIILIDKDYTHIQSGKLADVAPSILKLLNLEIPQEMDGNLLI